MFISILGFLFCAVLIFFSAKKLSFYGDIIAIHLNLGKAWIGLILMASVTSLPELTVGISSVTIAGSANLAVGDVIGSCAFNLLILSVLDAFYHEAPIFSRAAKSHVLAGGLGIVLLALVGLGIFLPQEIRVLGIMGVISIVFILVYFISIRIMYKYEIIENAIIDRVQKAEQKISLKTAGIRYALNAAITVAAAMFLPHFAEIIARESALSESFVGTLFLAASTSFPEIAVSFSALRMGSLDMAIGNLLGSNLFNILILAIDDIFYRQGHLLNDASETHIISIFFTIIMTAIAIVGIAFSKRNKKFLMAWDTLAMLAVYLINLVLLYSLSSD